MSSTPDLGGDQQLQAYAVQDTLTKVLEEKKRADAFLHALQTSHKGVQQQLEELREASSTEVAELKKELAHARESWDHLFHIHQSLVPVLKNLSTVECFTGISIAVLDSA
ncbi:hypothetical protein C0992_011286 [Termitomyces sp. T32_za158]|nr:hypothetical protein C0992_011286 [Termitomyces sp. T32_za158]